jgi:hypothetical protein
MSFIKSLETIYSDAAADVVKSAKFIAEKVLPVLEKASANASTVEAITSLVSPQAANVESAGFAVLGVVIKAIEDAGTAAGAGGLNVSLDATLVADIKSIIPAVKSAAPATPAVKAS